MALKSDEREKWTYLALSLLLHLALFLGLSWVALGNRGEQRSPRSLPALSVQVRLAEWAPLEPHPPQEVEKQPGKKVFPTPFLNSRLKGMEERVEKPPGQRVFPTRSRRGAMAGARPAPLAPPSLARERRDLPVPAAGSLPIPVSPRPLASVPPELLPERRAVAGAPAREDASGAPLIDLQALGAQETFLAPSPSLPAGSALGQGKQEEGGPPGKGTTAGSDSSPGKQGGDPAGNGTVAGVARNSEASPLKGGDPSRWGGDPLSLAEPRYLQNDRPIYPRLARLRGYEGTVLLEVEVGTDGRVEELVVKESSSYPILDEAALRAVRKWLFSPARRGGTPVASRVLVPIRFKLVEEQESSRW